MAESLVGKIVGNAGKQWSRNTVADGNWLNSNTVQKFNENDKTLAEAIESVSAAMEHFTPEITPSAWSCEPNQTIQTIEQNADGSLNVTYQPIESSTTSDDSLWSLFKQNEYASVLATYTETAADFNHKAGALSESLTIPAGIYDIKIEVLYEPTQSTINNKLDIAISKSTSIDDALYQTFILFDDSLIKDTTSNPQKIDVQSEWITGIIKLEASTTLKFLIKGESAQGRYKLNNIYINSIIGVKGDKGDPGTPGAPGTDGISPTVDVTPITNGQHIVITDKQGDHSFDLTNGESGEDGKTPLLQINSTNAHWQYRYSTSETWQDVPNTPAASGTKGDDGIPPLVRINNSTNYWEISTDNGSTWTSTDVSATGAPGRNGEDGFSPIITIDNTVTNQHTVSIQDETHTDSFTVFDGIDGISPTVSTSAIPGGNRVTFTYDDGGTPATEYIDVMSGVSGEPGKDGTNGVSPLIATEPIAGSPAGTRVIITDATHPETNPITFDVMNGRDGAGASYTFDSITLSGDGNTNPLGVDTNYIATHDWVGEQGFLKNTDLTDYATKSYTNEASAAAFSQAQTWVESEGYIKTIPNISANNGLSANGHTVGISNAGIDPNTQYAWTTSGWKPVQGGGGGSTYIAGEGIDITNDVISFDGLEVDTAYSGTLPKLDGNGTTEHPLSMSAFSNSIETTINSFSTALENLADEISSLGSAITLKGEGTCNDIGNYLNQAQVGDAYIATDNGNIWGKTVNKCDMVVKTSNSISVLTTSPDLSVYAKLSELPTVVPGANIVVTPTIVDGHTQYMITSVGGGGGTGMAYQFTSNDSRFTWSQSADDPQSPTVMTETLNINLPKFEAVTEMPGTTTPNTYYFVYEE